MTETGMPSDRDDRGAINREEMAGLDPDNMADVAPADLHAQLQRIKGAMGLEDRYPGQRRLWLIYGVLVAIAGVVTESIFAIQPLPEYGYILVWAALALVAGVATWRITAGTPSRRPANAPPLGQVLGALLLTFLVLVVMSGAVVAELPDAEGIGILQGAYYFGLVVALAGLGFVIVGTILRAYYIRRRDRLVFQIAGVWMLVFAAFLTQYEFLQLFGYAIFGALFLFHSIAAYVVLGGSTEA